MDREEIKSLFTNSSEFSLYPNYVVVDDEYPTVVLRYFESLRVPKNKAEFLATVKKYNQLSQPKERINIWSTHTLAEDHLSVETFESDLKIKEMLKLPPPDNYYCGLIVNEQEFNFVFVSFLTESNLHADNIVSLGYTCLKARDSLILNLP